MSSIKIIYSMAINEHAKMHKPNKAESKKANALTSLEKAAFILKALGIELSASIMSHLPYHEYKKLIAEIACNTHVDSETELRILREFYTILQALKYISEDNFELAKEVLETSFEKTEAENTFNKLLADLDSNYFCSNKYVETDSISAANGFQTLASILNHVDFKTKNTILNNLEKENPDLNSNNKNSMFVFEDLLFLDDFCIQLILEKVNIRELSTALKASSDELKNKIYINYATLIQKNMNFKGPIRLSAFDEIQNSIFESGHRLFDIAGPLRLSVIEEAQKHVLEVFHDLVGKQIIDIIRDSKKIEVFA